MKIAFIGLGNMGGSMAQNLLKSGQQVFGYDLSEVALKHFADAGGVICESPTAAAAQADIVITMLPAAKHVRDDGRHRICLAGVSLDSCNKLPQDLCKDNCQTGSLYVQSQWSPC